MAMTPWPASRGADPFSHLRRPVRLTQAALLAERAVRAFWPVWTVALVAVAPTLIGWARLVPVQAVWAWAGVCALAGLAALAWGLLRFRLPSTAEAEAAVDARLPGRPIATLRDRQAINTGDPQARAVWAAHLTRMAAATRAASAVAPDLRLATRDRFGLRYMAALVFAVAALFGGFWQAGQAVVPPGGDDAVVASGPAWEGWVEPPAYTGLPTLYLADQPPGPLALMPGSQITLRLYGEPGALQVVQTIATPLTDPGLAAQELMVTQEGRLAIIGPGGAEWQINLLPDLPPVVAPAGELQVSAQGEMTQPFTAEDDYGVVAGQATFALQVDGVTRSHGLAVDPDPRPDLVVDLPLPFTGERQDIAERLIEDFSQHPFANMPVVMSLSVTDAAGQVGVSAPVTMTLPGRRFFQPVARAVIELRRDLLWSGSNAPRVVQLLRAITHRPDDLFTSETIYLRARFIQRRLDAMVTEGRFDAAAQDEIALALWDLAVLLEEGTLADARERLRRAQERLSEAMRNGASPEEIAELMQELREATDDYLDLLAQNAEPAEDTTDEPQTGQQNGQEVTQDQIQALMDEIQRLMEEGRMAEAQELMDQLNALMENLQMQLTEGQGGMGNRRPVEQAMEDLGETLRDQQELSDEAFRELQEEFNGQNQPGQNQPGQESQPGQGNDPQPGEPGQGGPGDDPEGSLAERQESLRRELERQQGALPGLTGEEAEAAREALEEAEGAMDRAEEALREGDLAEAIDNQSRAMDALREGLQNLGQALAENRALDENQGIDPADGADAQGRTAPARRDPLGRQLGESGQFGSDQSLVPGQDLARRAEELLQELRRRAGEQDRPDLERDYLRRLLERF